MFLDNALIFAKGKSVTTGSNVTGVLDLLKGGDAVGTELYVHVIAVSGSGTGASASVAFRTSDSLSSGELSSPKTLHTASQVSSAAIAPGMELAVFRVPAGCLRYVDLAITMSGTLSSLKLDAFINADR